MSAGSSISARETRRKLRELPSANALAATVDMITEQVGSLFKRPDPAPPTTEVIDASVEATETDATTAPDTSNATNDTEARYGSDESPA